VNRKNDSLRNIENYRLAYRPRKALVYSLIGGVCSVFIDLDHIICSLVGIAPWVPSKDQFGCRLFHSALLPVSHALGCCAIALCIGLWLGALVYALGSTS